MYYPDQLALLYLNLDVRPLWRRPDGGISAHSPTLFCIAEYVSGLSNWRQQVRGNMRKWLKQKAAHPDWPVYELGHYWWSIDAGQFDSIASITDMNILHALSGKGTPDELRDTIKVASLMLQEESPNKALLGCSDLYTFCKWFLGLDCNGFVYAYYRVVFGWPDPKDHKPKWYTQGKRKHGLDEIQPLDQIFKWKDTDHIAIVSRIASRGTDYVECWVSESRGESSGGVQTNKWRFEKSGSGFQTKNLTKSGSRFIDEVWRFPIVG